MRWSESETCKFVKTYLKQECIWNPDHCDYKVRFRKQEAYNIISAEFEALTGISLHENEIKTKIKNLRSTYSQELAKIRQRSKNGAVYKPTIKWFGEMNKHIKKLSRTNTEEYENQTTDESSIWLQEEENMSDDRQEETFIQESDNDYTYLKLEPVLNSEKHKDTGQINYKIKKHKIKHHSSSSDCSERRTNNSTHTEVSTREDEFDIYGKYIATQLRSMDLQKALRLQVEIQSLVSEARISDMLNNID